MYTYIQVSEHFILVYVLVEDLPNLYCTSIIELYREKGGKLRIYFKMTSDSFVLGMAGYMCFYLPITLFSCLYACVYVCLK